MNADRRKQIAELVDKLRDLKCEAETIAEEERGAFDAMPEGLQGSERGQASESAADTLDDAVNSIDEALSYLEEAGT